MSNASDNAVEVRRAQSGRTVILFDARSLPQAGPDQLDPEGWPQSQALRGRGGRGTAVLVRGEFGEGVLRHYRRGGLVGRFITDRTQRVQNLDCVVSPRRDQRSTEERLAAERPNVASTAGVNVTEVKTATAIAR